jgi:hypothetical protein
MRAGQAPQLPPVSGQVLNKHLFDVLFFEVLFLKFYLLKFYFFTFIILKKKKSFYYSFISVVIK